jgi:hypothetical protein
MELNGVTIQNLKYCTIGLMTFARYFNICWDQNNTYRDFECCFVVWTKEIGKQTTLFFKVVPCGYSMVFSSFNLL